MFVYSFHTRGKCRVSILFWKTFGENLRDISYIRRSHGTDAGTVEFSGSRLYSSTGRLLRNAVSGGHKRSLCSDHSIMGAIHVVYLTKTKNCDTSMKLCTEIILGNFKRFSPKIAQNVYQSGQNGVGVEKIDRICFFLRNTSSQKR